MKKIILSIFLVGTLLNANAQVPSYVPSNGLVGWWPFSGNANDVSGNGNNGTVNGASLSSDRFGNPNAAYSFDGINDYIRCTSTGVVGSGSRTISFWIKSNSTLPGSIFSYGNNDNASQNYRVILNSTCLGMSAGITGNGVDYNYTASNNWDFFVVVFDNSIASNLTALKIYKNNILMSSTCSSVITSNLNTGNTHPITFGCFHWLSYTGNMQFFSGLTDDIGFWNRALNSTEISDLYNGCKLSVSTEPTNQSSNINAQAQFNVVLNDTTANYQWQSNQSNLGWVNVPSSSYYSGVTSKKLIVNNIQINNHKQLFRVIASKNTCKDTSVVAMLTVNDTCITSTTDTLYIKVNTSSLSNPIYNTVKVYPNPSSTQVIIDNGNYSTMGSYTAKIVNTAGQQVFQSVINQQQFVIDAKTMGGAGVYTLYITDANNKVVGVKKIVLQ